MRSSTVLALLSASLAVASPINKYLQKKAIVWDIVTEIEYVTVTEGHLPSSTADTETTVVVKNTVYVNPVPATTSSKVIPTTSSTPPPPPPPAPTTTSTPPPPPAPVTTAAPAPTTAAAPAPAPVVAEVAPVVETTTAAPSPVATEPASSPIIAAAANAAPSDYASTGTFWHNQHRADHSASALTWSDELASYAKVLADTCVFHHDQTIGGGGYGQNIDTVGVSGTNADTLVPAWDPNVVLANSASNNWYKAEVGNYQDYSNPSPVEGSAQFLHFTQMVWKGTTTVGCASTYCGQNKMPLGDAYAWYTVCNYGPAGNVEGEFNTELSAPLGLTVQDAPTPF